MKRFFLGVALLLGLLLLNGCTGKQLNSFRVESIQMDNEENIEPITLTLMHSFDDVGRLEWLEACLNSYTESHPDITFQVIYSSPDNYSDDLKRAYASGNMPDIYFLKNINDDLIYINKGYALELTNEIFMYDNFYSDALKAVEYHDRLWGVPIGWNVYGIIFNREILSSIGVVELPKSHEDFLALCKKLQEEIGIQPIVAGFKDIRSIENDLMVDISQSAYINGTDWRISIENDLYYWENNFFRFSDALHRMEQRMMYYNTNAAEFSELQAVELFASGEAAMMMGDLNTINSIEHQNKDISIGLFIFPWTDQEKLINLPIVSSGAFIANGKSEYKTYLVEFMEFLSTEKVGEYGQAYMLSLPVIKGIDAAHNPVYNEILYYFEEGQKANFSQYQSRFKDDKLNEVLEEALFRFVYDPEHDVTEIIDLLDKETQSIVGKSTSK